MSAGYLTPKPEEIYHVRTLGKRRCYLYCGRNEAD